MSSKPGPEKLFALDLMLGKLAKWLRLLGFDARMKDLSNPGEVPLLLSRGFIPVTRREKLKETVGVVFIESDRAFDQLKEVISRLSIDRSGLKMFSRCMVCSAPLSHISKEDAFGGVPDFVFETATDFRKCPECSRIYWAGTHRKRMLERLESITEWKQDAGGQDGGE